MTPDGSPAQAVYFFTSPEPARLLASKIACSDGDPVVLHFRVSPKKFDIRTDPEEEFGGNSVAFVPATPFAKTYITTVYTDVADQVPVRYKNRVQPLNAL
jgi:hypothetical protein